MAATHTQPRPAAERAPVGPGASPRFSEVQGHTPHRSCGAGPRTPSPLLFGCSGWGRATTTSDPGSSLPTTCLALTRQSSLTGPWRAQSGQAHSGPVHGKPAVSAGALSLLAGGHPATPSSSPQTLAAPVSGFPCHPTGTRPPSGRSLASPRYLPPLWQSSLLFWPLLFSGLHTPTPCAHVCHRPPLQVDQQGTCRLARQTCAPPGSPLQRSPRPPHSGPSPGQSWAPLLQKSGCGSPVCSAPNPDSF